MHLENTRADGCTSPLSHTELVCASNAAWSRDRDVRLFENEGPLGYRSGPMDLPNARLVLHTRIDADAMHSRAISQ
eukprot:IDg16145t1